MPAAGALVRVAALAGAILLAGCQAVPPAPPLPLPAPPQPKPLPAPQPVPAQPWDVADVAAGDWSYRLDGAGTIARFGDAGRVLLSLRCDLKTRQITLSRVGLSPAATQMTIRTSAGELVWPVMSGSGEPARMMATRPASDPGFDKIAASRGRISVELVGMPRLIVPVWAEVSRILEDCRS